MYLKILVRREDIVQFFLRISSLWTEQFSVINLQLPWKSWLYYFNSKVFFRVLRRFFKLHCMKSAQMRSFSGPYFPIFGLNMEIYSKNLRIQSDYRKIRTRKSFVFGRFLRSVSLKSKPTERRSAATSFP